MSAKVREINNIMVSEFYNKIICDNVIAKPIKSKKQNKKKKTVNAIKLIFNLSAFNHTQQHTSAGWQKQIFKQN